MSLNFIPRDYQLPLWDAAVEEWLAVSKAGGSVADCSDLTKRFLLVWPRRAGKDLTCLNILAYHALYIRPGVYYYFLPTKVQAGQIIWDGITKDGKKFLSAFPDDAIAHTNKTEKTIRLKNGSIIHLMGAQDEDTVVGAGPVGVVFSEYSVPKFNHQLWDYVRPMLVENGGWSLFIYTARGLNHGWRLFETNKNNPDWHVEFHTCETLLHDGKRVITDEVIEKERRAGMAEDKIRSEFYNDFYASNTGAYYGKEMRDALDERRIGDIKWNPSLPVHTAWDIGYRDSTAIWFFQSDGYGNFNFIESYSNSGKSLRHYIKELRKRPYVYGQHFGPHDMRNTNFGTGQSALEVGLQYGIRFQVVPKVGFADGVDAVRRVMGRCRWSEEHCMDGLEALRQYHKKDTGLTDMYGDPIYADKPEHDWSSHYADAFRMFAVAGERVLCDNVYSPDGTSIIELPTDAIVDEDLHNF